jgi:hypothetical protein
LNTLSHFHESVTLDEVNHNPVEKLLMEEQPLKESEKKEEKGNNEGDDHDSMNHFVFDGVLDLCGYWRLFPWSSKFFWIFMFLILSPFILEGVGVVLCLVVLLPLAEKVDDEGGGGEEQPNEDATNGEGEENEEEDREAKKKTQKDRKE